MIPTGRYSIIIITAREKHPSEYIRQEVERMEKDSMTQTELILWLETLAELIESKAKSVDEAVAIIREKAKRLK